MSLCVHCCILFAYCINVTRDYIQVDVAIKTLCEEYSVSVCTLLCMVCVLYQCSGALYSGGCGHQDTV